MIECTAAKTKVIMLVWLPMNTILAVKTSWLRLMHMLLMVSKIILKFSDWNKSSAIYSNHSTAITNCTRDKAKDATILLDFKDSLVSCYHCPMPGGRHSEI